MFEGSNLLSLILFAPLLGVAMLAFIPGRERGNLRAVAIVVTTLDFLLSLKLLADFKPSEAGMQFFTKAAWIPSFGISYEIGIDGISLFLVLLTTLLMPIVVLSSYAAITERVKEYMVAMLILETGMIGVFVSLDLFLFYVFYELSLIPMYLIIGVWGGPRRIYAAVKFFIFTMAGSLMMLLAILYLYFNSTDPETGRHTFDLLRLYGLSFPPDVEKLLFAGFALSFAIKVPMFPFHTWLPDAHVEAPTGGSVILAAILLKMGTYGFLRFAMPLFPHAALDFAPWIAALGIVGIIYGSAVALAQVDVKRLVAYSSVAHLGLVMVGLMARNVKAVEGAIYQMLNHGVSTGGLFLMVGVIYERRHTRLISDFGGVARKMPVYAGISLAIILSSIGLPGLNGFIGELLVLVGTFTSKVLPNAVLFACLAATGVVLGAVYMLRMFRKVMLGPITNKDNESLRDMTAREVVVFIPLLLLVLYMGVAPRFFTSRMDASVGKFISDFNAAVGSAEKPETLQQRKAEKLREPLKPVFSVPRRDADQRLKLLKPAIRDIFQKMRRPQKKK